MSRIAGSRSPACSSPPPGWRLVLPRTAVSEDEAAEELAG
jgi:hypothetical protein